MEAVVGVVHLIYLEDFLQASLVEWGIVRHKRQPLDFRGNLLPNIREYRSVFGVFLADAVHLLAEPFVVFGLRMDEAVERVHDLPVPDNNDSHAADAAAALVRCLEIYCSKIFHLY